MEGGFLFRSTSRVEWEETEKGIAPFQQFSLLREWNPRTAAELAVSGLWPNVPHTDEASYRLTATIRRQIYRRWLFLHIVPELEFPQVGGYDPTLRATLQMEAIFGDP